MSLVHTENDINRFFQDKNQDYSLAAIAKVERRIQNKKDAIKDLENELDLLKNQALRIYKSEVRYLTIGQQEMWAQAQKWISMLEKGTDSEGNKLDKRKKYPEKSVFEYLQTCIKDLFGIIGEFKINKIINHNYNEGICIDFSYLDRKWELRIPMVQNVKMKSYEEYGAYCFELTLYIYESDHVLTSINSTFEEDELKDILQLGVEKYCKGD